MKLAILSDIHGNLFALEAVLKDIKEKGIDKISILGDLAFCGPEPNETINFIKNNLNDAVIIMGNTDEMILKSTGKENDPYTPKKEVMINALQYSQKVITDDNKEFLASLPNQHIEEIEGLKMLFVHGSPRKIDEGIFPETRYSILAEMTKDVDANIVFCGHTHYPVIHQVENKTIVNVGSVGRPFGENVRSVYVVLDLTLVKQREFSIDHYYVKYDLESAVKKLYECDFDGAKILSFMLKQATDKFPEPSEIV